MSRRRLAPTGNETTEAVIAAMRERVRLEAADRPGVYRLLAPDGEVIYVGKSKRVRTRLLSYFRCAFPEEKGARLLREAASLEWDYEPSEFAALLREMRLIKQHRPRFNVALKRDARHYAFIRLTPPPAPRLTVVRGPGIDHRGTYYGPFFGAAQVEESLRELNDVLGLRDCSHDRRMRFSDQVEMFSVTRTPGCIRYEIGRCLGPCIAACSERDYAERVGLARAFLEGHEDGPMDALRSQMTAASEALEYERAASLRDKLERLESLRAQFERLRFAVEELSFVYPVAGEGGEDRVYVVRRGLVRAERPAPRDAGERSSLRELVAAIFSEEPPPAGAALPTHEIDEVLLLSYWFRKNPGELTRTEKAAASC